MVGQKQEIPKKDIWPPISREINRKVHGVPQSQAAANPWHQEEEKKLAF